MDYMFISLPIQLASQELIDEMPRLSYFEAKYIVYTCNTDKLIFSALHPENIIEYVCKSEEEFKLKVGQVRLLRML